MIIPNGYIRFRISAAQGMDSDGYPAPVADVWSNPIACQYLPQVNLQARSTGEAITAHQYTLYIERMVLPSEVVKLYDADDNEIGQFSVRSAEHLDAVCQTKIVL